MFVKRLLSAIVMIAIVIFGVTYGGMVLIALMGVVACGAMWELLKAVGLTDKNEGKLAPVIITIVISALSYGALYFLSDWKLTLLITMTLILIVGLAFYVFAYPKYAFNDVSALAVSYVYIAVCLSFVFVIRECMDNGNYLVWLVVIPAVASDTFAYCVGMLFGKHKLAPVVSPKKSVEGSVGGLVGAAALTGVYGLYLSKSLGWDTGIVLIFALIGLVLGGVSQIGDLAASAIKREKGIKDYGNVIPGHGGLLDRIDSVLYVAPMAYLGAYFILMYSR